MVAVLSFFLSFFFFFSLFLFILITPALEMTSFLVLIVHIRKCLSKRCGAYLIFQDFRCRAYSRAALFLKQRLFQDSLKHSNVSPTCGVQERL